MVILNPLVRSSNIIRLTPVINILLKLSAKENTMKYLPNKSSHHVRAFTTYATENLSCEISLTNS